MGCELKLIGLTSELSLNILILMSAATGRRNLHMMTFWRKSLSNIWGSLALAVIVIGPVLLVPTPAAA